MSKRALFFGIWIAGAELAVLLLARMWYMGEFSGNVFLMRCLYLTFVLSPALAAVVTVTNMDGKFKGMGTRTLFVSFFMLLFVAGFIEYVRLVGFC